MAKILKYSYLFLFLILCTTLYAQKKKSVVFEIVTPYGVMKGMLYDETPKHKENFIKLVNEGFYDSLLFHRVINEFMIQGGDPDSKKARAGAVLGNGGPGYTIPAEFVEGIYHKRGALAAARLGDAQNPTKASSGSQFYVVQGIVLDEDKIEITEQKTRQALQQQNFDKLYRNPDYQLLTRSYINASRRRDTVKLDSLNLILDPLIEPDSSDYMMSAKQKEIYTTLGGTPFLDGSYTVFGEIYEGLEVMDSIAVQPVDRRARPKEDIPFIIRMVD